MTDTAFKFLSSGGLGLFSNFAWPLPANGSPGAWVTAGLPLEPCVRGIHVCREEDLPYWIDDELWAVELRGEVVEAERMVLAEAGRLVRRIAGWNDETAAGFAEACALRVRVAAVESLRRAGRDADAATLEASPDAAAVVQAARTILQADAGAESTALAFAADAAALARGARPEETPDETAVFGAPSPGAVAANLAYVGAHIAGCAAGAPGGADYEAAVEAERAWQRGRFVALVAGTPA